MYSPPLWSASTRLLEMSTSVERDRTLTLFSSITLGPRSREYNIVNRDQAGLDHLMLGSSWTVYDYASMLALSG
jgi:hypothetical protein